jgi:uncharacterized protein YacL
MLKRVIRGVCTVIGMVLGYLLGVVACRGRWQSVLFVSKSWIQQHQWLTIILFVIIFGFIFYFIFPLVAKVGKSISESVEKAMAEVRLADIVLGIFGLIIGLLIAMLICVPISQIPIRWLSSVITLVVYVLMAYLGVIIPVRKRDQIMSSLQTMRENSGGFSKRLNRKKTANPLEEHAKVLDTSAIIDGRIYDIIQSGFLEGPLVVPSFVLSELQLLADNGDDLKRVRGRRGLDIINKMQSEYGGMIHIVDKDYPNLRGVDDKLLEMGQEEKMKIITNDYNLNKVAKVRGIPVLNINALANAVKPVVLPGETMQVHPVKNGKESGQAVAYLDDGTMIVVENGRRFIGQKIVVTVTSVLQTAAGRMIFGKADQH